MPLSEGVQARLTYKAYTSGALAANSESVPASAPAASGGQVLRRVQHDLNLRKNTFRSNEVRTDRQIGDFRHGQRRVEGTISGELSPNTWLDMIDAAHRTTRTSGLAKTEAEFTSCAADAAASTFTLGGGDPVTEGFRVGDLIHFAALSAVANNLVRFVITGFSGASNRTVHVWPAPADMTADTAFLMNRGSTGSAVASSGHVSRLFAFEDYDESNDIARLFTECRVGGYRISVPTEGIATIDVPVLGRGMATYSGASAPFFTSPTAQTAAGLLSSASGLVRVGGTTVGVVTGLDVSLSLGAVAPPVAFQDFPPEIFLGRADVTGTLNAFFDDLTLVDYFRNETEVEILAVLRTGTTGLWGGMSIHLPRVKLGGADVQRSGEGPQSLTMPFQALRYLGAAGGIEQTTIRISDAAAV